MAYRDNDADRQVEELEAELKRQRVRKTLLRKEFYATIVRWAVEIVDWLAWRLGLLLIIYGFSSFLESCHEGPPVHVDPVWVWKPGVAVTTFALCLFGQQVVRWIQKSG